MKGHEKMKDTKGVTEGFGALLAFGRMDLILIEMKKFSFGHLMETLLDIQ